MELTSFVHSTENTLSNYEEWWYHKILQIKIYKNIRLRIVAIVAIDNNNYNAIYIL